MHVERTKAVLSIVYINGIGLRALPNDINWPFIGTYLEGVSAAPVVEILKDHLKVYTVTVVSNWSEYFYWRGFKNEMGPFRFLVTEKAIIL